uniref:Rab3 GTPase-activating protein non-catalytic subunit n=1 Tax=Trichobilharzia regenti TaxID=157069 RepID=A0AA85K6N7_TRIRE|nr:unnamed protein product [Trichobilharzia regenti]
MSLSAVLKCDFSEVDRPTELIRKAVIFIPWSLGIVVIGLQERLLIYQGLSGSRDKFVLIAKLNCSSYITAINYLNFSSNISDAERGWSVIVVGLADGKLLFLDENTDPGASHFASFIYQEAKRAMFGFKNNYSESLVVTWPGSENDLTYPVVQCSSLPNISLSFSHGLADSRRSILSSGIGISSDHHWMAVPDSLGRVLLIDTYKERAVRMWKGYRDAEVAFLEVTDSETLYVSSHNQPNNAVRKTLCLLIHAPHLHLLELWCLVHGPRVVSWDVVEPVRLIQTECHAYSCLRESNDSKPKFNQVVLIDGSGRVYSISLNSSLCLSENNTEAAVDYREYKILQRVYETLEQYGNNLTLDQFSTGLSDLLIQFETMQWCERALIHVLSHPNLSPHLILDIIKRCIQSMTSDEDTSKQFNVMNIKICKNVEYLVNFYLTFHSFYDRDDTGIEERCVFTKESFNSCIEFIADLLSWDPEDAGRCLQQYAICASVLGTATTVVRKPLPIQSFLNSFHYAFVTNTDGENTSTDSLGNDIQESKQHLLPRIRSDNARKTLTTIGCVIFEAYINGLQTFDSLRKIVDSSNLDPILLLFSFVLFILNEDKYLNLPILIYRMHHIFCYMLYRILLELLSSSSSSSEGENKEEEDEEEGGGSKKGERKENDKISEEYFYEFLDIKNKKSTSSCTKFELICKQIYVYCSNSCHLSSAYLIALIMRCLLFQIWQTFESEENILEVLFKCMQHPEFTVNNSPDSGAEIENNNSVNQSIEFKIPLRVSSKWNADFIPNLQQLVDKWHQTCAQLEGVLSIGLVLLCPVSNKSKDATPQRTFDFNLQCVLTNGRSYLTALFASWIVKNNISAEQVLSFYQGLCTKSLISEDCSSTRDLAIMDPVHLRQVIFSLAYKRLPFTLELDTVLSTVCWTHFQIWREKPEDINNLIDCIEFLKKFSSAGTMIAQGLGTIMWRKGLIDWLKPILDVARGDHRKIPQFEKSGAYFPRISDVSMCLIDFFKIYSYVCQRAEVVPVFSVEAEWNDPDSFDDKSLHVTSRIHKDNEGIDSTDLNTVDYSPSECLTNEMSSERSFKSDGAFDRKFSVQDTVNQPIPQLTSINSWEQVVIVASALLVFGRPEKLNKSNQQATDTKFYSLSDFFPPQDLYMLLSPNDPNWISTSVGKDVGDSLMISRRFFLSWLIERCVSCLSLSPVSQYSNRSVMENDDEIPLDDCMNNHTFEAVEVYRRFSSAAFTLAHHWNLPKDTVTILHVVSLFEKHLDDQALLFLSKVQDPTNLAVRLLFIIGRRIAYRCYGSEYNAKQTLRLRVFIPLTVESWLRGLLPVTESTSSESEYCQNSFQPTSVSADLEKLPPLIDYVIEHLPRHTGQLSIAIELRDILQAIVQSDTM